LKGSEEGGEGTLSSLRGEAKRWATHSLNWRKKSDATLCKKQEEDEGA